MFDLVSKVHVRDSKPDFKDGPCIAFYSLNCIAINNRH